MSSQNQNIQDVLLKIQDLKTKGNLFFKEKSYKDALKQYHKMILQLKAYQPNDELKQYSKVKLEKDQIQEINDLLVVTYQNMSQCHICLQNYERARDCADDALKIKITEKALYKKAISQIYLSNLEDSEKLINQLNQMNVDVADLKNLFKQQQKIQDKQVQNMYKKMF